MAASWWTMKGSRTDERLRLESPAYQPDAAWDELEPQGMQVVMSVRFDARSARKIATLAREAGRSPSSLIRDWTLDRLHARPADLAGVREASTTYTADDQDYEVLRQRYRPEQIDMLLVGESRPASGTFFFLANSNLFYATHEAFQLAFGPMPAGEAFLAALQQRRIWLYDLADEPVDRMRGRPRRSAVQARIGELVTLLRESRPRLVVAIKKDLSAIVRAAVDEAGLSEDRLSVLPFPLYQWRAEYVRGLASLLGGGSRQGMSVQSPRKRPAAATGARASIRP